MPENKITVSKDWLEGLIKAAADAQKDRKMFMYLLGFIDSVKIMLEDQPTTKKD